jgi:hypothetical protein
MSDPFQRKLWEKPLTFQDAIAKTVYSILRSRKVKIINYEHILYAGGVKSITEERAIEGDVVHSISDLEIKKISLRKENSIELLFIEFKNGSFRLPVGRITNLDVYLFKESHETREEPIPIDLLIVYGDFRKIATQIVTRERIAETVFKVLYAEGFIDKLSSLSNEYKEIRILE